MVSRTIHTADGSVRGLRRADAAARAGAVVEQQAGRFRGMRRHRREGRDQGRAGPPGSATAIRNSPAGASPAAATPISISCRTGTSTSPGRTRRRKSRRKSTKQYIAYLEQERRSTIAAAFTARQQQLVQQASLKSEGEKIPVPRGNPARQQQAAATSESAVRRPEVWRPEVTDQGHQLRQGFLLLRMAAAFRRHQGHQEAVQPVAEQAEAELTRPKRSSLRSIDVRRPVRTRAEPHTAVPRTVRALSRQTSFAIIAGRWLRCRFKPAAHPGSARASSSGEPLPATSALLISATMRRDSGTCSPWRSAISVMTPCR